MVEAAIPSKPDNVKPARNIRTVEQPKKPERPAPDISIDRKAERKAKNTDLITMPEGHKCVRVEYWLPEEHDYNDVLNPLYWSSITTRFLKPISTDGDFAGSIVCVRPHDHSFYAELYVTEVNKGSVNLEQLFYKQFGPQLKDIKHEKFFVKWNAAAKGYDILRKVDNAIVGSARDFKRLESVQRWLERMGD